MKQSPITGGNEPTPGEIDPHRNRLEIIRFSSAEAHREAIRVLMECGKLTVTSFEPDVWNVRTEVVRALLAKNVPFEWVTRNLM